MKDIFEKLKSGAPVDMMSEEYLPAIRCGEYSLQG